MHDTRYSAPNLDMVTASDDARARELASARLASSPHHLMVEVFEEDRLVCVVRRAGTIAAESSFPDL
jgi:hypothetical protein